MKKSAFNRQLLSIIFLFSVAACNLIEPRPAPTQTMQSFIAPTQRAAQPPPAQTPGEPLVPAPETDQPSTVTQYGFDVDLNYVEHTLQIAQSITYTNNTGDALSEIPLIVPPAYHDNAFNLTALEIDQAFPNTVVSMEGAQIRLRLGQQLNPGRQLHLNLNFDLHPPQGWGAFGYTDRQMLLADWYPFIPPYTEGRGWVINSPANVGEHLVYPLSDFTVNLQIADTEEDLIVAASTSHAFQEENTYRYRAESVRNFSLAVSPIYQTTTLSSDLATVMVYTFPEHAGMGKRTARLTLKAWETFTELYGSNHRNFVSVVEADISDGLETDGLFFLSDWYFKTADETPRNYYELLVVHETAHLWFYGFVHNDQALEPWLDEALATYSELLFVEKHHPDLVNWWWHFRVYTYDPVGSVNASIYDFNAYQSYIDSVYLLGASFLQSVRDRIGDPDFFEFLRLYTQAGEEDFLRDADFFFDMLAEITDEDIAQIKSNFFK